MVGCARKPDSQFSCNSYPPFDIVILYIIIYDSLNKNLSVITDFYFDVFPKSIGIFLQYYQGGYSASALEAGQILRLDPGNI